MHVVTVSMVTNVKRYVQIATIVTKHPGTVRHAGIDIMARNVNSSAMKTA